MTTQTTPATIKLDEGIKLEVAKAIVEQSHPGYSLSGYYYTDGHEVWFASSTRPWDPWPDGRQTVEVSAFVADKNLILSPVPESYSDWSDHEEFRAWEAAYQSAGADDSYAPKDGVLDWARANRPQEYDAFLQAYEQEVVDFCYAEMDDEVTLESQP